MYYATHLGIILAFHLLKRGIIPLKYTVKRGIILSNYIYKRGIIPPKYKRLITNHNQ